MDLQTRKLNLIAYLTHLQDEKLLLKLENYIIKKHEDKQNPFKPFTIKELKNRIEKSEQDYQNKNIISQEELDYLSSNW